MTYETILFISIGAWVLAAIRQFPYKFKYYFILLAIADPLVFSLRELYMLPTYDVRSVIADPFAFLSYQLNSVSEWSDIMYTIYLATTILLYFITNSYLKFKASLLFNTIIGIALVMLYFLTENSMYVNAGVHIVIFFRFFLLATLTIFEKKHINIFYYIVTLYEVTLIINLLRALMAAQNQAQFYYLLFILQIFIALFCSIFTQNTRFLQVKLFSGAPKDDTPINIEQES